MASPDHIDILTMGADAWNNLRLSNLSVNLDLSDVDFIDLEVFNLELKRYNFYRTDLSRCKLTSQDMRKGMLKEANFAGASLSFCDFSSSNLQMVDLTDARISGCNFSKSDLSRAKLDNSTMFLSVEIPEDFRDQETIVPISFTSCAMTGATLRNITITESYNLEEVLEDTLAYDADFSKAQNNEEELDRLDRKYNNITTVNLSRSGFIPQHGKFLTLDFRDADLTNATFANSTLTGKRMYVDFSRATLIGTDFRLANITDCNLWETRRANWKIKGVICDGAFWDEGLIQRLMYNKGEFERSYGEHVKLRLQYPGGMSPVELAMLPSLLLALKTTTQIVLFISGQLKTAV